MQVSGDVYVFIQSPINSDGVFLRFRGKERYMFIREESRTVRHMHRGVIPQLIRPSDLQCHKLRPASACISAEKVIFSISIEG